MRILILLLLTVFPALALAQSDPANFPLTSVCDLKEDNNGDCISDAIGDTVCVEGIVIAWKEFGSRGPGAIYDPVNGCCISIFDINNAADYAPGTKVRVCGWVGNFAGLLEIIDQPGMGSNDPVVTLLDAGPFPVPVPNVPGADLQDFSARAESLESCLIDVCGQFVDTGDFLPFSANYDFVTEDGSTITIRIDADTGVEGTAIPVGLVTVRGILSQFNAFQDNCTGYQLLPRSTSDFLSPSCQLEGDLDIKPGSCPNPLTPMSQGVIPAALLGSATFDLSQVDVSTLALEGVAPIRVSIDDVGSPIADPKDDCDCEGSAPDGFDDLTLKFDTQDIISALGPLTGGDVIELTLTGELLDGTPFTASDCMRVNRTGPPNGTPGPAFTSARQILPGGPAEIEYSVPAAMQVELTVVDVTGRRVAQLLNEPMSSGEHRFTWDARSLPSGLYFLRLSSGQLQDVRRIVIQH